MIKKQTYILFFPMMLQMGYWGMLKVALPILPHLDKIFNTSVVYITLMLALSFMLSGLSAIVWGPLLEHQTIKRVAFTVMCFGIITLTIVSLTQTFWIFFLFYIASCILISSLSVYSRAFPMLYLTDPEIIKKSILFRLCGGYTAAFFAPLLGGFIGEYYGWRYLFLVIIVWLILLYCLARRIGNVSCPGKKTGFILNIKQMREHLKNRNFVFYLIILSCGNAVTQSYVVSTPFWLETTYHIPVHEIAFYLFPLLFTGMRLPFLPSYIARKVSERNRTILYMTLFISGGLMPFILMQLVDAPAWVWVVPGVLAAMGVVGMSPYLSYHAMKQLDTSFNSASSLLSICSYLAGGIAMSMTLHITIPNFYMEGVFILCLATIMCYLFWKLRNVKIS